MKRAYVIFVFSIALFTFTCSVRVTDAATKYWIGPSGGSFANDAHWSTTNGGSNDTTAPGSLDVATFTSADTDSVAIDSTISVSGINIVSGYTGTLTQSAAVEVIVGAGNFSMA